MEINDIVYEVNINLDTVDAIDEYASAIVWITPWIIKGYSEKENKYFIVDEILDNQVVYIENIDKPYKYIGNRFYSTKEKARVAARDFIFSQIIWKDEEGAKHE